MSDETLFSDALAITDLVARAAFLDRECPDPMQRQRVAELLAAVARSHLLDRPPADFARTGAYEPATGKDSASVGDRIGPYKLLEKIGEGGMGEVWVADQLEPIKRRVAIKLIKSGMDSRSVLGRFEAERQALAVMDHPNISKVLDAGTTTDGRPYFVMELVKGTPITEFCDARKLTPKQRLELFIPVCHAIQHAHMKGIIHRDIKPSNVLVALHDESPVAKVIDFGVAKAIGQQLSENTIYTGFGALVGTPAYMAPEQASFNQLDVDTRADVYALGVLLYELLAGSPPIEAERMKKAALDEVLRIVRDEEPPRPSQRLSTSQAKASIAATRGSEPAKLSALMKGEIDWIVMKALEKDRTRRYDTANGLAKDIQRYLSGDSVEACPPTLGYRLRKAYRKNRVSIVTSGAFVFVLFAATLVSLIHATRATLAERDAIHHGLRAEEERQKAEVEVRKARKQTEIAEAVKEFLERDLIAQANPLDAGRGDNRPDPDLKLKTALDRAVPHIAKRFEGKPLIEASIRRAIGNAYLGRGLFSEAQTQLEKACELYRMELTQLERDDVETLVRQPYLEAMFELINLYSSQGQKQKALATIPMLEEQVRQSHGDAPERKMILEMMAGLREILEGKDPTQAIEKNRELLRKIFGEKSSEQPAGSRTRERKSQAKDDRAAEEGVMDALQQMENFTAAIKLMNQGKYADAERGLKQLIEPRRAKGEVDVLVMIPMLAEVQRLQGKFAEARANYESARDGIRKALGEDHPSLGACHYGLAQTLLSEKKYPQAEAEVRAALAFYEKRMSDDLIRFEVMGMLGAALVGQKKYADAEPLLLKGYQGLKDREKTIPELGKIRIPEALDRLIDLSVATNKPDDVRKWRAERAKYPEVTPLPQEKK